jgi:hypothetical protein
VLLPQGCRLHAILVWYRPSQTSERRQIFTGFITYFYIIITSGSLLTRHVQSNILLLLCINNFSIHTEHQLVEVSCRPFSTNQSTTASRPVSLPLLFTIYIPVCSGKPTIYFHMSLQKVFLHCAKRKLDAWILKSELTRLYHSVKLQ